VGLDPRAKFTVAERTAQYELMGRLSALLNHMSWAVDAIIGVRDGAGQRAAKVAASDPLKKQLADLAAAMDAIRSKIVATKEGGAITGEERLREFVATVYGDVSSWDGHPTEAQVLRTETLTRELEDVIAEFTKATAALAGINRDLQAKSAAPIMVLAEKDWQAGESGAGGGQLPPRFGGWR